MFHFEKKVLDNGLRVIVAQMENTEAVTLSVFVRVGSRYEPLRVHGISHFLEHLFFKGTRRRPNPGDINKELDMIGAEHNAFTSKETTGFWVKSSAKDFDKSLDIISDILLEPLFKEEEIEKERGIILQEINMYEDEPRRKVIDILENIIYDRQPVGRDISGTKDSIKKIKRQDILNYKDDNYLSKNIVVVVAGNIKKDIAFKKIEEKFIRMKKGNNKKPKKTLIHQKFPAVKIVSKDIDQTHLTLAFRAYDMFDEKRYILNLISVILGGYSSSKLFAEIREKMGLAYYVYSYGDQYMDCGYLGIGTGIPHDKLETVVKKITEIVKNVKNGGITKNDLEHAKSYLRGQMALKFEGSDEVAYFIAGQEMFYKKIMQPIDIIKKIEKVSQNDIVKVAKDIFRPYKINMAVIGNHKDLIKKEKYYKKLFLEI